MHEYVYFICTFIKVKFYIKFIYLEVDMVQSTTLTYYTVCTDQKLVYEGE